MHFLYQSAGAFGITLTDRQLSLFQLYLDELWEWNQHVNITGLRAREKIISELFLDSLVPAPFLPEKGRLLDVGSGGGFPGIPLKITKSGLITTLLEPNAKRGSFLQHVIRLLQLSQIQVVRGRIEKEEPFLSRTGFNVITARALASPQQTLLWCAPLMHSEGMLVLFLGAHPEKELRACDEVMKARCLTVFKSIAYRLPGKTIERNTLILKKR